jgi:hypothetical protein
MGYATPIELYNVFLLVEQASFMLNHLNALQNLIKQTRLDPDYTLFFYQGLLPN